MKCGHKAIKKYKKKKKTNVPDSFNDIVFNIVWSFYSSFVLFSVVRAGPRK